MANDKTLVLSKAATLEMCDYGGTLASVGYTRGGVQIAKTYETRPILCDQTRFPLHMAVTNEAYTINFRLMEITEANLRNAWGETDDADTDAGVGGSLSLGVYADDPEERTIRIYAKNKGGTDYVCFVFWRCVLTATGTLNYSREDEGLIEATFTAMYDDSYSAVGLFVRGQTLPSP